MRRIWIYCAFIRLHTTTTMFSSFSLHHETHTHTIPEKWGFFSHPLYYIRLNKDKSFPTTYSRTGMQCIILLKWLLQRLEFKLIFILISIWSDYCINQNLLENVLSLEVFLGKITQCIHALCVWWRATSKWKKKKSSRTMTSWRKHVCGAVACINTENPKRKQLQMKYSNDGKQWSLLPVV